MSIKIKQKQCVNIIAICLLVFMTIAIFIQVRNHEFIGYDDDRYITKNVHVQQGITWKSVHWAFSTTAVGNWHPLTWLSHLLDVQLFGMNAGDHHLVNILLHLLNAVLLYFLWKSMTGEVWKSFFVAALFAVHPLHVESVAWIAERKDMLSGFFWMLTLLCYAQYTKRPNRGRYLLALLFFMLGLMAKPMLVTLPFVLILLDFWPLKRFQHLFSIEATAQSRMLLIRALVLEKAVFFILALLSSLVTFWAQHGGGAVGSLQMYPLFTRIVNALVAYAMYMVKMFLPTKLAVLYPHTGMPTLWKVLMAVIIFTTITYVSFRYARKFPWLCFGWLWYLGTLVPVIGLVQVGGQSMADRYTYIPMIGLLVIVAWGVPFFFSNVQRQRFMLFTLAAAAILLLSVRSWHQVRYWSDSITLFEHAVSVTDDNYIMHNNLGFELQAKGRAAEALEHYTKALEISPNFVKAHTNIGLVLAEQGKYEEAVAVNREVLRINPNLIDAHLNLGYTKLRQGQIRAAFGHYLDVLQLNPASADAYNGMGATMVAAGNYEKAVTYFRKALEQNSLHPHAGENLEKTLAMSEKMPHASEDAAH